MDKGEYIKQQNKWIGFLKHKIGDKIPNAFGDGTIEVKDWNYMMNIVQLVQLHAQFFFKPIRALSPLSELISKVIGQYQIRIGKAFLDMEVRNYELVKNEVEIEPGIAGNQKAFSYLVDSLLRFYKAFLEEKRKQLINQPEVKSGIRNTGTTKRFRNF